ncbi:unnamed protein product [Fusarium venenatum]|uniref:Uncharacterized protein n=1 Tax=Fusarium venenatum TaxID=56646 RepID=A0A2L2TG91_9HYPO|nr:uncharacterized protein FVRRES_12038 [Fusarium venenatum]CEI39347.1 unnamed protein product [Fusarium venenatum]
MYVPANLLQGAHPLTPRFPITTAVHEELLLASNLEQGPKDRQRQTIQNTGAPVFPFLSTTPAFANDSSKAKQSKAKLNKQMLDTIKFTLSLRSRRRQGS